MEKERRKNAELLDQRNETKKLAEHPDPFIINQSRHYDFFNKTNKIQDHRHNLYQS
jgi:hypothetical protein